MLQGRTHMVLLRIDQLTKDALRLAAKGAAYSANAKLTEVLQLIADHLDAEDGGADHSAALSLGLTALREAEDFSRIGSSPGGSTDVASRALGHTTPVLRDKDTARMARVQALELYQSFASRQLAQAVMDVPEGSMALYHLGRLQPFLSDGRDQNTVMVTARMIALQEAALLADADNYRAANELGVVLAKNGRWQASRKALSYSIDIGRRPETQRNLSLVLHKLGDEQAARDMFTLAVKRQREWQLRKPSRESDERRSIVRWVDAQEFSSRTVSADLDAEPLLRPDQSLTGGKPVRVETRLTADAKAEHKGFSLFRLFGGGDDRSQPTIPDFRSASADEANAPTHRQVNYESEIPAGEGDEIVAPPMMVDPSSYAPTFESDFYRQGEYIGPARAPHVPQYYLRVSDGLGFVFRMNGRPSTQPYRLSVGDVIRITSLTVPTLEVETLVQPDGTIVLPQIGSVVAVGRTMEALRQELDARYLEFIRDPSITIAPVAINKTVEELRAAIINRSGIFNGQIFAGVVSPNGMIQLPAIGSVPAQGLTLDELRTEVEWRYAEIAGGIEVTPILQTRAARAVYVIGEVQAPGRYEMIAPTSVIQSITLAGGWNKGGNLRQVIVLRRDENWSLMATRVNVRGALYNKKNLYTEDIWLRDSDIVIVSKQPIQVADDYIEMLFTRGIYGVVPFNGITLSFFKDLTTLAAIPGVNSTQ